MWLIKISCFATIWASQPCEIYPGHAVTATLVEMQVFQSETQFDNRAMCERIGRNVAYQDEARTGNLYYAECSKH
jgi:hypothetical protein